MTKTKSYTVIGKGENCPKCHRTMDRRSHKKLKSKQTEAPFYFSAWDYCWGCHHLQHYEHFKVVNNNHKALQLQRRLAEIQEREAQLNFFKSI